MTTRDFTTGLATPSATAAADAYGHGTHVASLIGGDKAEVKGVAPGVFVVAEMAHPRLRERMDGVLHETADLDIGIHQSLLSKLKVLASLDITEKRKPQDGRFRYRVGSRIGPCQYHHHR